MILQNDIKHHNSKRNHGRFDMVLLYLTKINMILIDTYQIMATWIFLTKLSKTDFS